MTNKSLGSVKKSLGNQNWYAATTVSLLVLATASCGFSPGRVNQPGMNPSAAGSQALEMYDTNGDGVVSGAELEKAPGLKAALPRLDTNGDKGVSADEVTERIKQWQGTRTARMSFPFRVTLDGVPLTGALVTFEPEKFLGDQIRPATCTTNTFGGGGASIPQELRSEAEMTLPGMNLGIYRVKISKIVGGKETIPHKYNEESVLGQEVAADVTEILNNRVAYALTTK